MGDEHTRLSDVKKKMFCFEKMNIAAPKDEPWKINSTDEPPSENGWIYVLFQDGDNYTWRKAFVVRVMRLINGAHWVQLRYSHVTKTQRLHAWGLSTIAMRDETEVSPNAVVLPHILGFYVTTEDGPEYPPTFWAKTTEDAPESVIPKYMEQTLEHGKVAAAAIRHKESTKRAKEQSKSRRELLRIVAEKEREVDRRRLLDSARYNPYRR